MFLFEYSHLADKGEFVCFALESVDNADNSQNESQHTNNKADKAYNRADKSGNKAEPILEQFDVAEYKSVEPIKCS